MLFSVYVFRRRPPEESRDFRTHGSASGFRHVIPHPILEFRKIAAFMHRFEISPLWVRSHPEWPKTASHRSHTSGTRGGFQCSDLVQRSKDVSIISYDTTDEPYQYGRPHMSSLDPSSSTGAFSYHSRYAHLRRRLYKRKRNQH